MKIGTAICVVGLAIVVALLVCTGHEDFVKAVGFGLLDVGAVLLIALFFLLLMFVL